MRNYLLSIKMKPFFRIIGLLLICQLVWIDSMMAQRMDTAFIHPINAQPKQPVRYLSATSFIVPGLLIGYGFWANHNPTLQQLNRSLQEAVYTQRPHAKLTIDDYLQYTPAALTIGLSVAGIKGKDNTRDIVFIYALSNIVLNASVQTVKHSTHQLRPDGSAYNSFPSGHTAEAFASAALLSMEYKDQSPWYGIAGYSIAAATGYLRMYNNKHWLNDVLAGAGFGIASTKIAYWAYAKLRPHLFKNRKNGAILLPTYQLGHVGLALVYQPN